MSKVQPRTLSGFMELLPARQAQFDRMVEILRRTYGLYGFTPLDTPLIEASEVLLAKGGGETEKQICLLYTSHAAELEQAEQTRQAMDWFWQIDEAYVLGRYSLCRELIQSLEDSGLSERLPQESTTDNGRFSPALRYQEIREALYLSLIHI